MESFLEKIRAQALSGEGIGAADALAVLSLPDEALWRLLDVTESVRRHFKGDGIRLCSIVNAKSGSCSEDCSFCSQSSRSKAEIPRHPLLPVEEIFRAASEAKARGAREFSIVTSGLALRKRDEMIRVGDAVERIGKELGLETCVSLGTLPAADVRYLLSRGLRSIHHNLETSRSFFPNICTTHEYDEDVAAVRAAKAAGAWVCCGGIFGLGESPEDRVELALTLRELEVDSIPVNFLNPVPGTPVEGRRELDPIGCLRIIAMLRLTNPRKEIIVCGGREANLRGLQSLMFAAGASGTMAGNYLTTAGRPAEEDLQMLRDLGLARLHCDRPRIPASPSTRRKAVILLSGGLDSTLAARMLVDLGIDLYAIHFTSPFCTCDRAVNRNGAGCHSQARIVADRLGIPIRTVPKGEEYLDIIRFPRHGRGKGMNPCIDCRIFTLKKAREYMEEIGASFLVTGEVIGQRPMSQREDAMRTIEKHSGCAGIVLRPLSALHLPPTVPELEGWVDREKLLAINGRCRKEQMRLAGEWAIGDYPCPAGGCLLADRTFSVKVRDLVENDPGFGMFDVHLLKFGRHFRVGPVRAVVTKSEEENRRLEAFCRGKVPVYISESHPGPSIVLLGGNPDERMAVLSRILTRYSKADRPGPYQVREVSPDAERIATVPEDRDFAEVGRGLLC